MLVLIDAAWHKALAFTVLVLFHDLGQAVAMNLLKDIPMKSSINWLLAHDLRNIY